jgi:regulator of RNase E activity RraA
MRSLIQRLLPVLLLIFFHVTNAQQIQISKEQLIALTPEWKGERFTDGRPKAPDSLLNRLKLVTLEEAWAVLRNENYKFQYEDGWQTINPDSVLVGRAVTATFMPGRPDIHRVIDSFGHAKGGRIKSQNSWPLDILVKRDVYVADQFGAHIDGPTIGDNLGNSIFAKTGNGIVYDGAIRDINGLKELGSFTSFFRSYHPSPHLLEKVVKTSEIVRLRDMFGHQRLREGKYTPGQIDTRWSDEIEKDFSKWLNDHINELPVPKEQIQELLKSRTW